MADILDILRERVTPETARNWAGRLLQKLTKRDNDDLVRIRARLSDSAIIRYFAAGHMDPIFCGSREEKVHKAFGEAIEGAYHKFIADLAIANENDRASRGYSYLSDRGYDVVHVPEGWRAVLHNAPVSSTVHTAALAAWHEVSEAAIAALDVA